jgi:hypothetical protein
MALRRWLPLLAVAISCGRDETPETETKVVLPPLDDDRMCTQLAKLCADQSKHVEKMVEDCKVAAKKQRAKGCIEKVNAAYDCYERELCGKAEKVWAIGDFGVLTERHNKCVTERSVMRTCIGE